MWFHKKLICPRIKVFVHEKSFQDVCSAVDKNNFQLKSFIIFYPHHFCIVPLSIPMLTSSELMAICASVSIKNLELYYVFNWKNYFQFSEYSLLLPHQSLLQELTDELFEVVSYKQINNVSCWVHLLNEFVQNCFWNFSRWSWHA